MVKKDKQQRNSRILVYFIAFIMVGSIFGVVFYGIDTGEKVSYKGQKFYAIQGWWMTTMEKQRLYFTYHPALTEDIVLSEEVKALLNNPIEIDTTYDAHDPFNQTIGLIQYQLSQRLQPKSIFSRTGQLENSSLTLPVITCLDSTPQVPVIIFTRGNDANITHEGSCITVQASSELELLRHADRISFQLLGIMQ